MKRVVKKGFTIVELAIVIAVIAVLAAVLIPTISGMVKKAKISAARSKAANMSITIAMEDVECNYSIVQIRKTLQEYNYTFDTGLSDYYFFWNTESRKIDLHDVSEVTADDIKVCVNYIQLLKAPAATASVDGTVVAYADEETSGEWQSLISTAELFEVLENFDGKKSPESLFKKGSFALTCFSSVKETMVIAYKTVVNGEPSVVYYQNGREIDAVAAKAALGYVDEEKGFENNNGTYIFMTMTAHETLPTAFPVNIVVTKELSPFEEIIMSIFSGENFDAINGAMKLDNGDPFATMYLTGGIEDGAYLANIVLDPEHVYGGMQNGATLYGDAQAAFAGIQKIFEILGSEAVAEIGELSDIYIGQNVVEKMTQFVQNYEQSGDTAYDQFVQNYEQLSDEEFDELGMLKSKLFKMVILDFETPIQDYTAVSFPSADKVNSCLSSLEAYEDWQTDYLFQLLSGVFNAWSSSNELVMDIQTYTAMLLGNSLPAILNSLISGLVQQNKLTDSVQFSQQSINIIINAMVDTSDVNVKSVVEKVFVAAYGSAEEVQSYFTEGDTTNIVNDNLDKLKAGFDFSNGRSYNRHEVISILRDNTVKVVTDMMRQIFVHILDADTSVEEPNFSEESKLATAFFYIDKVLGDENIGLINTHVSDSDEEAKLTFVQHLQFAIVQAMDRVSAYGKTFYDAGITFSSFANYGNGINEWYAEDAGKLSEVINGKKNMLALLAYMANEKGTSFIVLDPNDSSNITDIASVLIFYGLASFDGVTLLVKTTCTYQTSDGHTVSNPLNFLFRFSIGEAAAA